MNAALLIVAAVVVFRAAGAWSKSKDRRIQESGIHPPPGRGTDDDVWRLAEAREKIAAIELYRELHGAGLNTAKESVEALARQRRPGSPPSIR